MSAVTIIVTAHEVTVTLPVALNHAKIPSENSSPVPSSKAKEKSLNVTILMMVRIKK
ncbi:hypothetical protein GCM10011274_17380 [Paraglaciecola chathamensis]|uniref:Uncharacterized protein n=1 Tax=Paraglaciecola chathamensis TaxID=368405 RepID=A0A8H9IAK8_9ALTE|nr:hypothetical protein GCM10011274_17380 [Paraglaciecola oceanifecundans]